MKPFILLNVMYSFILVHYVTSKYLIKKKPKIPEPTEWGVPEAPEMAYDVYPGVEINTLDQTYDEMISGEDIAQIEVTIGKVLPLNAALGLKLLPQLISNANKP